MKPRRDPLIHSGEVIMRFRINKTHKLDSGCKNPNKEVSEHYTLSLMDVKEFPNMRVMKQRGISDIIAVLLLLGITVAGAVLVAAFFQGNNIFRPDASSPGTQTASIKIIGYDTRDGTDLSGITNMNNFIDAPVPFLCTTTCAGALVDTMPVAGATGGTEFIILTVQNKGINKSTLQSVEVSGIEHPWDSATAGDDLITTSIPKAGYFSIISTSNALPIKQKPTNELLRNDEVRLVIKLSENIDPDLADPTVDDMYRDQPIVIRLITNLLDPPATVITSGGVR